MKPTKIDRAKNLPRLAPASRAARQFVVIAVIATAWVSAFAVSDANASTKRHRFEFTWETQYVDAPYGDYWLETGVQSRPAKGVYATVVRYGYEDDPLFDGYADDNGHTNYLWLNSNYWYRITVKGKAIDPQGNVIWVRQNDVTHNERSQEFFYKPPADSDYWATVPIEYEMIDDDVNASSMIAAASFAVDRRNGQITNNTWYMYTQACDGGGSCMDDGKVKIDEDMRKHKFMIIHEMGHYLGWKKNGNESAMSNCEYTGSSPCGSASGDHHLISSEEYQSCAAVWNDWTKDDCETWCPYGPQNGLWDCGSGNNRLENVCGESESDTYRGCEFDWLRFWWDLHTAEDVSFGVIANSWGDSEVDGWNNTDVYLHLKNGASANGIRAQTFGLYGSYHGVDHHVD
jgi:hypothetical protein